MAQRHEQDSADYTGATDTFSWRAALLPQVVRAFRRGIPGDFNVLGWRVHALHDIRSLGRPCSQSIERMLTGF
jgi:hypothetical protein